MGGQLSIVPDGEQNSAMVVVQVAANGAEQQVPPNTWYNQPNYATPVRPPPGYGAPTGYGYPPGATPYTAPPAQPQYWPTGQQLQQPFSGYQQQVPYGYSPTGPVQYANQNYYGQMPLGPGYPTQAYFQPGQPGFYVSATVSNNEQQLPHTPNCQVGVCVCPNVVTTSPAQPSPAVQVQNTQSTAEKIAEKVWKKLEQRKAKENSNKKSAISQKQFPTEPDDTVHHVNLPTQPKTPAEWTLDNIHLPHSLKTVSQIEPSGKRKPVDFEAPKVDDDDDDYLNSFSPPMESKKTPAKSSTASEIPSATEHSKAQFSTIIPTNIESSGKKKNKYVKPITSSFFALPQSDTKLIETSTENDGVTTSPAVSSSTNNDKSIISKKKKTKNKSASSIKSTKSRKSLSSRKSSTLMKSKKSNKLVKLDEGSESSTIGSGIGSKSLKFLTDKELSPQSLKTEPKESNVSEVRKPALTLSESCPILNDRSQPDLPTAAKTEEFDAKLLSSSSSSELLQSNTNKSVQPTLSTITPQAENYKPLFESASALLLRNADKPADICQEESANRKPCSQSSQSNKKNPISPLNEDNKKMFDEDELGGGSKKPSSVTCQSNQTVKDDTKHEKKDK